MDFVLIIISSLFAVFIAVRINRKSKEEDISAIEKEVGNDFKLDFEEESPGVLTNRGMNDLVEWLEDDLMTRRITQSKEIDDFEELK